MPSSLLAAAMTGDDTAVERLPRDMLELVRQGVARRASDQLRRAVLDPAAVGCGRLAEMRSAREIGDAVETLAALEPAVEGVERIGGWDRVGSLDMRTLMFHRLHFPASIGQQDVALLAPGERYMERYSRRGFVVPSFCPRGEPAPPEGCPHTGGTIYLPVEGSAQTGGRRRIHCEFTFCVASRERRFLPAREATSWNVIAGIDLRDLIELGLSNPVVQYEAALAQCHAAEVERITGAVGRSA